MLCSMDQFDFICHCDFCRRPVWLDSTRELVTVIDFASAAASSDTSEVEDLPDQVLRKPGLRAAGMQVCDDGNREGGALMKTLR